MGESIDMSFVCDGCLNRSRPNEKGCHILGMILPEYATRCNHAIYTHKNSCVTCKYRDRFINIRKNANLCTRKAVDKSSLNGCITITDVEYKSIEKNGCEFWKGVDS
ncbi:MAG: hypothetical protein AMQ22_00611 [Candidatus Methanofastidiosum methylothiophilum]|uniref:Uncharacterized protein n=1 Tax=Candidatus Methanofastidiosum methylothiophilum TaxID=1705564 RepID=A0A150J6J1_9EURY|nr:MAG: hypothetical protein AMQ22_00611 [Candidatus Methanofastidiosum methylthiophilus]